MTLLEISKHPDFLALCGCKNKPCLTLMWVCQKTRCSRRSCTKEAVRKIERKAIAKLRLIPELRALLEQYEALEHVQTHWQKLHEEG
jgi:hypothetical protein